MKKYIALALSLVLLVACSSKPKATKKDVEYGPEPVLTGFTPDPAKTIEVTLNTNKGKIVMDLFQDLAPESVNNFATLANSGYYDGVIFHRIIKDFMIQGGDPTGTGSGNPGYSIKGEFAANGYDNPLEHTRGVLSMARSQNPDSAGSQFFIMHGDSPHLDGNYAAFGIVTEGMDIVDEIAHAEVKGERPTEEIVIESSSVKTNGLNIDEFTKLK